MDGDNTGNTQTGQDYLQIEHRLAFWCRVLARAAEFLDGADKPSILGQVATPAAIATDKIRLELGEVTSRVEQISSDGARDRVASHLQVLAKRKAPRPTAMQASDAEPTAEPVADSAAKAS